MKPETADCLTKARECLDGANHCPRSRRGRLTLPLFTPPKRTFSTKPVAQSKTHRGLRTTLSRLARNEPRIAPQYLTFLARAYELKSIADYSVGSVARPITADDAARAIETAQRFIDTITQLLPPGLTPPPGPDAQP